MDRDVLEAILSDPEREAFPLDALGITGVEKKKIKALMVAPHDLPRAVWMPVSLEAFRIAVNMGSEEDGDVKARKVDDNI